MVLVFLNLRPYPGFLFSYYQYFRKKEYKCCTCLSLVSFFRASVPIVEIFFNSLLSVGLKLVSNSLRSCDAFWAASLLNLAYTNLASTYNLKILINHKFLYVIQKHFLDYFVLLLLLSLYLIKYYNTCHKTIVEMILTYLQVSWSSRL